MNNIPPKKREFKKKTVTIITYPRDLDSIVRWVTLFQITNKSATPEQRTLQLKEIVSGMEKQNGVYETLNILKQAFLYYNKKTYTDTLYHKHLLK